MNPLYIEAIETRLRWLRFVEADKQFRVTPEGVRDFKRGGMAVIEQTVKQLRANFGILPYYGYTLAHGPTYFMDKHFCQMVDHARQITPDEMKFEGEWLHSDEGWLWLEEPFYVPPIVEAHRMYRETGDEIWLTLNCYMAAVGWWKIPPGTEVPDNSRWGAGRDTDGVRVAGERTYQFLMFQKNANQEQFQTWSYFCVHDGEILGERIQRFEQLALDANDGCQYMRRPEDVLLHPLHEMRWLYAAFHLMAQRLTSRVREQTDRGVRRRAERDHQVAPPFIEIVTLRSQHQARQAAEHAREVDWQWQWTVRGHWRDQWYPSEGIHKPVFIEAFIKGPKEKPLKPPTVKLFAAVR